MHKDCKGTHGDRDDIGLPKDYAVMKQGEPGVVQFLYRGLQVALCMLYAPHTGSNGHRPKFEAHAYGRTHMQEKAARRLNCALTLCGPESHASLMPVHDILFCCRRLILAQTKTQ